MAGAPRTPSQRPPRRPPAAERLAPLARGLLGADLPVALRAWDGSTAGPPDSPATVVLHSPRALRRVLWAPGELGLGRALASGDASVEGDLEAFLRIPDTLEHRPDLGLRGRRALGLVAAAARLGALGPPPPPPPEEARVGGRLHSRGRDARAVRHHYDLGNDFYRLLLGDGLTYSCGYWPSEPARRGPEHLDEAQDAKHDLVCRKLGLRPGMRLLDVGCGWGSMVIHAAREHGVRAVGVTVSPAQAALARERVAAAGLADRVEVRLCDYRDVADGPYDAISSIGMAEHVGLGMLPVYARTLVSLLRPEGRLLHHAISRAPGPVVDARRSVLVRYVFPDGELHPLGTTVRVLEGTGFEIRDVEALREHYALTLRAWLARLDARVAEAEAMTSPGRVRIWRLYLTASVLAFEQRRTGVDQVLAVRPDPRGRSGVGLRREEWLAAGAPRVPGARAAVPTQAGEPHRQADPAGRVDRAAPRGR